MTFKVSSPLVMGMLLVSCGAPESGNVVGELSKPQPNSESKVDDKTLGLSSSNGFQYGSAVTGAKVGIGKAFRSFVNYQNASGRRCSGVLGYDDVADGSASVYFYTASHCFEKRTPLGKRVTSSVTVGSPKSYLQPWLEENVFSRNILANSPQIFRYTDGRNSDVVRTFQFRAPLTGEAGQYLPLCYLSDFNGLQAVGYTNPRQTTNRGVVWANTPITPPELPTGLVNLLALATNATNYKWAPGVITSPGDSGSPVYAVKRAADGVGVDSYQCIFGVITREVWSNKGCSGGVCKMKGESVYERVRTMNASSGKWESYAPPAN